MQITADIGLTKFTSLTIEIDPEDVDLIEGNPASNSLQTAHSSEGPPIKSSGDLILNR